MDAPSPPPFPESAGPWRQSDDLYLGRSGTLIALLYIGMALSILIALADILGTLTFATWSDMEAEPEGVGEIALMALVGLGALAYLVVFITGVVLFCIWIHRANRNARALGAIGMMFTPGWCVGWWFVPIANLFKPYQAVKEVYQASDPRSDPGDWHHGEVPATFLLWWSTWIAGNLMGYVSLRMSFSADPGTVAASSWVGVLETLITIPCCIAVVQIVRGIEKRQLAKASGEAGA